MNNLPIETLRNIIHYAGKSAKFINSRFYEIALDCKWNYKIIDLSTITIDELIKLKNSNVEYIKVIVTKDRSKKELIEVIQFLFDINKFKGVHIKASLFLKSNEEIDFFRKHFHLFDYKLMIVYQLFIGIQKQTFINNVIINFSDNSDELNKLNNNIEIKRFICLIDSIDNDILEFINLIKNYKINNFILFLYNFDIKNDFSLCNRKYMYFYNDVKDTYTYEYSEDNSFMSCVLCSEYHNHNSDEDKLTFEEVLIKDFGVDSLNKILKLK